MKKQNNKGNNLASSENKIKLPLIRINKAQ